MRIRTSDIQLRSNIWLPRKKKIKFNFESWGNCPKYDGKPQGLWTYGSGAEYSSRRKAAEFLDDIKTGKSSPLKNITSDYHYHVVEADSEETLDMIEAALPEKRISSGTGRMGKKAVLRITKEREVRHRNRCITYHMFGNIMQNKN